MKRLISGMEAVQAGLAMVSPCIPQRLRTADSPVHRLLAFPCVETVDTCDAFCLWRSLPGYRKACRMLRRSGRRIGGLRAMARLLEPAKPDVAVVRGPEELDAVMREFLGDPNNWCTGLDALPDAATLNRFARELCGPVPEHFVPTRGVYLDTTEMRTPPVNDLAATLDLPPFLGIERANYPEWKAKLNTETAATILERIEAMKE